jgi:hypothetical protein
MNIIFIDKKEETIKIPEVGQAWMHKSGGEVYMRIVDHLGARALDHDLEEKKKYFYSVDLKSGYIRHTDKNPYNSNVVLLEPVGGEIHFSKIK